jgi:hypothetical protein
MAKRSTQTQFIFDEGPYHRILRDIAAREYHCYCPRDEYIGSVSSAFEAERKVEAARYDKLQSGMIGPADLHLAAA